MRRVNRNRTAIRPWIWMDGRRRRWLPVTTIIIVHGGKNEKCICSTEKANKAFLRRRPIKQSVLAKTTDRVLRIGSINLWFLAAKTACGKFHYYHSHHVSKLAYFPLLPTVSLRSHQTPDLTHTPHQRASYILYKTFNWAVNSNKSFRKIVSPHAKHFPSSVHDHTSYTTGHATRTYVCVHYCAYILRHTRI